MNAPAQPLWFLFLSLGVTGSIVGAVVAGVTSVLNDRSRRRFELRKWQAEFYLRPKLEALRQLHAAMVRAHYEVNMRAKARMPRTVQEYREQVEQPEMDFFGALTGAQIYFDAETADIMRAVLGSVRQMSTSIWLRVPEIFENRGKHEDVALREPDWMLFSESFEVAQTKLRHLLNPTELIRWAEK